MLHLQYIFFECLGIYLISTQLQTVYGGIPLLYTGPSLKDEQINLDELWDEEKPIRYYKYVIIVYSRAVESRMDVERAKDLKQLENMKAASWTWDSKDIVTKYSKLMEVAKSVLQDFHNAIVTEKDNLSFTQKAFYYRALIWVEMKMRLPNTGEQSQEIQSLHQSFKEMIEKFHSPEVAENHLPEMYTEGSSLDIIKRAQNVFRVDSLKNFGIYEDAAIDLMLKIKSNGVGCIKLGNFEKIQPDDYELILTDINCEKIRNKFGFGSFQMLMYMDKAFYLQENKFYEFQPLSVEDYRMSTAASDIERWKYALIFLYRKIRDTLIYFLTIGDESLLTFLDSFLGHDKGRILRIQCLTYFHTKILPKISYIMKSVGYTATESITRKVYCARVLAWFHYTLLKDEHLSIQTPSIVVKNEDKTSTLQYTYQYVKKILDEEVENNKLIKMFSLDVEKGVEAVDSWNDLTSLGNEEEVILELFLDFMKKKQQRDSNGKYNNPKEDNKEENDPKAETKEENGLEEEEKEEADPKEEDNEEAYPKGEHNEETHPKEEEKDEADPKEEDNEETHLKEEEKENNDPKEKKNRWGKILKKVRLPRAPSIQIMIRRLSFRASKKGAIENKEENDPKKGETDPMKPNTKQVEKKQQRDSNEKYNNLKEENKEENDPKAETKEENGLQEKEKEEADPKEEDNEVTYPKEEDNEETQVRLLRAPSIQKGAIENKEENDPKKVETDPMKPNIREGIKQEIYENMLQKVDRRSFASMFLLEPYQMLMYMDYAFYYQNHNNLIFQRIPTDDLNFQVMGSGDLKSWKYAMIHLYRRVEDTYFGDARVDSENIKLLEYLSDKNDPEKLRLSCVAFLCVHILKEIHDRIQAADSTTQGIVNQIYGEIIRGEKTGVDPHPSPEVLATFQEILDVIRSDLTYQGKPQDNAFKPLIKELKLKIVLRSNLDASAIEEESSDETTETEETKPYWAYGENNVNNSTADNASWWAPVTRIIGQITELLGFS